MSAEVVALDRSRIAERRVRKARSRGRCGATHPDYADVPCQRPFGHGTRYAHGARGWGNSVKGILYWRDDQAPRFLADSDNAGLPGGAL